MESTGEAPFGTSGKHGIRSERPVQLTPIPWTLNRKAGKVGKSLHFFPFFPAFLLEIGCDGSARRSLPAPED